MSVSMLSESLKIVRLYWGKTQSELAQELNLSQAYISELERGKAEITLSVLQKYSATLGVPLSSLLIFSENLEGTRHKGSSHLFLAEKALAILRALVPNAEEE